VQGLLALTASKYAVELGNSGNGFDDFNILWCHALNEAEAGNITHFAMLHLDVVPLVDPDDPLWLDVLMGELEEELPGWQIKVGPREAVDLPRFLKTAW